MFCHYKTDSRGHMSRKGWSFNLLLCFVEKICWLFSDFWPSPWGIWNDNILFSISSKSIRDSILKTWTWFDSILQTFNSTENWRQTFVVFLVSQFSVLSLLGKVPKSINRTIKYKSRAKKRRDSIKAYKNFYLLSCTLNDFCLFWSHLNPFSSWIIWNY